MNAFDPQIAQISQIGAEVRFPPTRRRPARIALEDRFQRTDARLFGN
jgi:hypothetical protein